MADLLGRYRLDDRLGEGGMGVVYRAWDPVLERVVALKLMIGDTNADPAARERFFREARSAAQLTHKNIVTVYDLGEHLGQPYLAMEFLDGEDLQRRLARREKASVWRKLDIAIEICHGIEFAHAHGVIHRDLKPGNIFITASGGVKILDFGLARFLSSQLTRSNMLLGTINYMSPEQVRGERADQQSDVFSIGVVLYELFGGRRAFEGDSAASTLYKILQEPPEPLWKLDSGLPRELTTIIDRALAKPRDERYADVGSLRRDLELVLHTSPLAGPPTPWPDAVVASGVAPAPDPSRRTPVSPMPTTPPPVHPVFPPSAPDSGAGPPAAPAVAAAPAARAGNTRGFWIGAGLGALAIAFVVVWMANRRVEPVSSPTSTVPAQTRSASETAPSVPPAPAAPPEAQPAPAPSRAPESDRKTEARRDAVTAAPPAARRPARGEKPTAPAGETPAAPSAPAPATVQPTVANPPPQPSPAPTAPAPTIPAPTTPATQPEPSPPSAAATQPAAPAPAPAPAVEPPPLSRERANDLLERYKAALEAKSVDQLRRIWPSLGGTAETALRREFQHASRITVDISELQVAANGATGRMTFVRRYSILTDDGQRLQRTSQATMDVHRSGDTWLIDSIGFTPR